MEEKNEISEKPEPRRKRRVSLFKRRKRSDLRPFVKEKKSRQYKKYILLFLFFVFFLFLISAFLFLLRNVVIPQLFERKFNIVSPQGKMIPSDAQIRILISESGLNVSDLSVATDSGIITFTLNSKTQIVISKYKDLNAQLDLIKAIDRKILSDGKQAISIDLRYNKPIVRF